ncbi:S41 family peptidase [Gemmatimonadota bacterium]
MKHREQINTVIGLLLMLAALSACQNLIVTPSESDLGVADFEVAWRAIDDDYVYLEFKGINWDSMYTEFLPRAETTRGDEFYDVLHDLLCQLKDGHVFYVTPGGSEIYPWTPPRRLRDEGLYNPFVVRKYFDGDLRRSSSGQIEYGILPDNIGYIFLAGFHEHYLIDDFYAVLNALRTTSGLILDIRQRQGGSLQNIDAVVSRFLTEPLTRNEFYRAGGELLEFPPLQPRGSNPWTKPVVVLINGLTFSAGELCTEMLKQLPHVTAVGDTTGGGSAGNNWDAPGEYLLPSGRYIHIGTLDGRRYDGLPYEWNGVPPDVRIVQTMADILAGHDRQLEYAIDLLK